MKRIYWVFLFLGACSPQSQNETTNPPNKSEKKYTSCAVSFEAKDTLKVVALKANALRTDPCYLQDEEILNQL